VQRIKKGFVALNIISLALILFPIATKPIDDQRFLVRQHYGDFLVNRNGPDESGLNLRTGDISGLAGPATATI
jgi:hypothetical protein